MSLLSLLSIPSLRLEVERDAVIDPEQSLFGVSSFWKMHQRDHYAWHHPIIPVEISL